MSGNRGAKGSIKDRLISMLYRMRYKKKKLKEEDYTINKKNKQKDYLNNLNDFKYTENINILDSKDKKTLDKTKFRAKYNVNLKKGVDIKLQQIESKTHELDDKVDIKKEIKKTNDEIIILKEVDKFIKKSLDNILEIKEEVSILKKKSSEKDIDIVKLEEEYKVLKEKINKLKMQYESIKDKYDFSEFSILESIKLMDSIDNYKTLASLNEIDMMLNVCKKEINKIDEVKIIVKDKNEISVNIENTKQNQNNIKLKFIKVKEKNSSISSIENELREELKIQEEIIDDMYLEASYFEKKLVKSVEYIHHGKFLSSLFRIAGGILTLPFTGINLFGKALGTTLINKGLKEMNQSLQKKEKITINYKYEDISNKIKNVKDKVKYIDLMLTDSLNEIKKLKYNFNENFGEYKMILPNYYDMMEKIDSLESKLLDEQIKVSKMNNKLQKEEEVNKQKLMKMGSK